ncbi:MAG: hypothetical protein D6699_06805 [Aquificota bacterium]|nr:MAG: hypothetical protein D6699_06805 [Aquificota bacterium]
MTDFLLEFFRILLALGIVLVLIFLLLPHMLPLISKIGPKGEKDSSVKLKRIIPLGKGFMIVELEIKGRLYVVAFAEGAIKVLHKDENPTD